jgi:hypothetical protein
MLGVRFPAAQGRPGTSGSYQRGDAVTIREGWPREAEFRCKAVEKRYPHEEGSIMTKRRQKNKYLDMGRITPIQADASFGA